MNVFVHQIKTIWFYGFYFHMYYINLYSFKAALYKGQSHGHYDDEQSWKGSKRGKEMRLFHK